MENPVLRLSSSRKAKALLLSVFALAAIVLSMHPSGASAQTANEYSGKNLPGHTWTTGNGVVLGNEFMINGRANTTSSVCVGPVTYDGTFHAPYGWSCNTEQQQWVFSPITAAAGLYNPNAGTFGSFFVLAWGQ